MIYDSRLRTNLYIVGFMATGKSSVARRLARKLRFRYIDSDRAIEEKEGRKIKDIFEENGEEYFRGLEREFVESGHPSQECIVACGGGLILQSDLLEILRSRGVVICLFASVETILKRTSNSKKRPLLNIENRDAQIRRLITERGPAYSEAGIGVSTENCSISDVTEHVARVYRKAATAFESKSGT